VNQAREYRKPPKDPGLPLRALPRKYRTVKHLRVVDPATQEWNTAPKDKTRPAGYIPGISPAPQLSRKLFAPCVTATAAERRRARYKIFNAELNTSSKAQAKRDRSQTDIQYKFEAPIFLQNSRGGTKPIVQRGFASFFQVLVKTSTKAREAGVEGAGVLVCFCLLKNDEIVCSWPRRTGSKNESFFRMDRESPHRARSKHFARRR